MNKRVEHKIKHLGKAVLYRKTRVVQAALDVLETPGKENSIAALANMAELGDYAADGHMEVGNYVAKKKSFFFLWLRELCQVQRKGCYSSRISQGGSISFLQN